MPCGHPSPPGLFSPHVIDGPFPGRWRPGQSRPRVALPGPGRRPGDRRRSRHGRGQPALSPGRGLGRGASWRRWVGRWLGRGEDHGGEGLPTLPGRRLANSIAIMQGRISRSRLAGRAGRRARRPAPRPTPACSIITGAKEAIAAGRTATEHMLPLPCPGRRAEVDAAAFLLMPSGRHRPGPPKYSTAPATAPFLTDWRGPLPRRRPAASSGPGRRRGGRGGRRLRCGQRAISPQGGNTGLCGGNATPDKRCRRGRLLGRLTAIRAVDAANNALTVEAGCTWRRRSARGPGLFPLSPAAEGSCQIGGNPSTNAGGSRSCVTAMPGTHPRLEVVPPAAPHGTASRDCKDNTG